MLSYDLFNIRFYIQKKKNTSIDDFLFKIIGVLAFDKNTGFWMISSIPRFPAITSKGYMFQNEQKKNGQIVLCVTVDQKYQDKIGNDIFLIKTKHFYSFF